MRQFLVATTALAMAFALLSSGAALAAGKGKTAGPDTNAATGIGQDDGLVPPGKGGTPPGQAKKLASEPDFSNEELGREEDAVPGDPTDTEPPGEPDDGDGRPTLN